MKRQKSFLEHNESGQLYIVPTPIGNLQDMTFRAIETLRSVDLIAAEDTRQTKKLCAHFGISTPLESYHEHNKETKGKFLLACLKEGKRVALVSDAGMPGVSDPGRELVKSCVDNDIVVTPLPGANAALTALVASGLATTPFLFFGFLPRKSKERKEALERLSALTTTLIFYEAPHRLEQMLRDVLAVMGNRNIVLARELTKRHEEFSRGTVADLLEMVETEGVKGECCLVIEGNCAVSAEPEWWCGMSVEDHVNHYVNEGMLPKLAIKQVAKDRQLPKRQVYATYHGFPEKK